MTTRTQPLTGARNVRVKRVPNAQRSATTRAKIINAAIDCLHEVGYHQTSTVLVSERARVSRGAMLHHFPSKADLIIAVAERLQQMRGELHRERLAKARTTRQRFLMLVDVLWEAMLSPSGIARIELMLSTRSDPEMSDRFEALNDELDRRHKAVIWSYAEDLGLSGKRHKAKMDAFVQLYAAALRGLAIDALRSKSRKGADASVGLLKEFQIKMLDDLLGR